MKRLLCLALLLPCFLLACSRKSEPDQGEGAVPSEAALATFSRVPNFEFEDQDGQSFDSSSLKGKIWVANIFLVRCPGKCPEMIQGIRDIHDAYAENGDLQFVSITANPDEERVGDLAEYAQRWGADTQRWHFLRSDHATTCDLISQGFKLPCDRLNPMNHSFRLVLIDREGMIRGYYEGLDPLSRKALRKDIDRLLED